ncbi:MAG: hypothetical protein FD123_1317 [Bacteroidetes bacterium]|nr:MAG: hypothetical protein FD123_1317 [Bacteroidota bacterium]
MEEQQELLTVCRSRGPLLVRDAWYHNAPAYHDADVIYYLQSEKKFGDEWYEQFTLLSDLSPDEETIFASFGKSCREKIRSVSGRNDVRYTLFQQPSETVFARFISDYNKLSEYKGIARAEEARMRSYLGKNLLALSLVTDDRDRTLVWHVYRYNKSRVLLLYTVALWFEFPDSQARNFVGKVNRYAHWMDMTGFRAQGARLYDWGGWYNGASDEEKLRINKFKEEFGGLVKENYNCIVYRSWKGKMFRMLKKIKS